MNEHETACSKLYASLLDYLQTRDKSSEHKRAKALSIIEEQGFENRQTIYQNYKKMTLTQFHVLHEIGLHPLSNVTLISNQINVTKGGVSKAIAKLLQWGLVEEYHSPDNKKEIYYQLTAEGTHLASVHDKLHHILEERHFQIFSNYTTEELNIIQRFLSELTAMNKMPL